jgi:hypothetical protein
MEAGTLFRAFDARRLRLLIALLFVTLAVPTAVVIWQAWGQLKWEAYYQHRGMAEELTARIDAELGERIRVAEARSFGDFSFLVVSGDPAANFLQRSPLAEYPVPQDLPGVIGYFQVDADGSFRTPLLPPAGAAMDKMGIPPEELEQRRARSPSGFIGCWPTTASCVNLRTSMQRFAKTGAKSDTDPIQTWPTKCRLLTKSHGNLKRARTITVSRSSTN